MLSEVWLDRMVKASAGFEAQVKEGARCGNCSGRRLLLGSLLRRPRGRSRSAWVGLFDMCRL